MGLAAVCILANAIKPREAGMSKAKGDLLEDLVALLHQGEGVVVQKRQRLPSKNLNGSPREIDVLITTETAVGYPVQLAIECKNEVGPLEIGLVDAFAGKLDDVGIPTQLGILVSANGYTNGAQTRAQTLGIRTLRFEGLSPSRLEHEINAALQSVLFLLASVTHVSRLPYVEDMTWQTAPLSATLDAEVEPNLPSILMGVWSLWVGNKIPATIGKHVAHLLPTNAAGHWHVIADVTVTGHLLSLPGVYTRSALRNTSTNTVEKVRIDAKFEEIHEPQTLQTITSEPDLNQMMQQVSAAFQLRIRVPRIATDKSYWPPSAAAARRAEELLKRGKPVSFEDIEGTNIVSAWRV